MSECVNVYLLSVLSLWQPVQGLPCFLSRTSSSRLQFPCVGPVVKKIDEDIKDYSNGQKYLPLY